MATYILLVAVAACLAVSCTAVHPLLQRTALLPADGALAPLMHPGAHPSFYSPSSAGWPLNLTDSDSFAEAFEDGQALSAEAPLRFLPIELPFQWFTTYHHPIPRFESPLDEARSASNASSPLSPSSLDPAPFPSSLLSFDPFLGDLRAASPFSAARPWLTDGVVAETSAVDGDFSAAALPPLAEAATPPPPRRAPWSEEAALEHFGKLTRRSRGGRVGEVRYRCRHCAQVYGRGRGWVGCFAKPPAKFASRERMEEHILRHLEATIRRNLHRVGLTAGLAWTGPPGPPSPPPPPLLSIAPTSRQWRWSRQSSPSRLLAGNGGDGGQSEASGPLVVGRTRRLDRWIDHSSRL